MLHHQPCQMYLLRSCFMAILCAYLQTAIAEEPVEDGKGDPTSAEAETAQLPGDKFMHFDHLLGFQLSPLGILYEFNPYFKWHLFPDSDNILLEDAHIKAGLTTNLTPAYAYYGPSITIAPLTILHLTAQFTHVIYGVAGPSLGLLDYNFEEGGQYANYDYQYRDDLGGDIGEFTAEIWSLFLKPAFFMQVGPIVFVYLGNYMYFHPTNHEGLYYNDIADLILTPKSWCLMNDAMLLYEIASLKEHGFAVLAGVDNQINVAIDDDATEDFDTAYRWKIGPMVAWTITDQWLDYAIEEPTVLLQGHYFVEDPIMTGKERTLGMVLAFMMSTNWYR
ncbi:MAG: hypothetical protein QNJ97_04080 [Myxococcota bacterium]|nr:hypothetical protein [Myxococcota bacterium]